jgi:hypothetical protein
MHFEKSHDVFLPSFRLPRFSSHNEQATRRVGASFAVLLTNRRRHFRDLLTVRQLGFTSSPPKACLLFFPPNHEFLTDDSFGRLFMS